MAIIIQVPNKVPKSRYLRMVPMLCAAFLICLSSCGTDDTSYPAQLPDSQSKLPVKIVIVTMFEIGEDLGDAPGEFQFWRERRNLYHKLDFPHSHHDLFYNPDSQILGLVTGIGTAKAASATMALGLDDRFDLSRAYWLVAGIAGIDPEDASIGSVVWSSVLVDGDLGYEIDSREMPEEWSTGYFSFKTKAPFAQPRPELPMGEVFVTNRGLRDWAFDLTKNLNLMDSSEFQALREAYVDHPAARRPPFVLRGGHLAAMTYWHGALKNEWANELVKYWSDGEANFVTSAMEETGTYQSITYLDNTGLVDKTRFLVLRGGSNFTMQPPNLTAEQSLLRESDGYAGLEASLENVYLAGSVVIDELLNGWDQYSESVPTAMGFPDKVE